MQDKLQFLQTLLFQFMPSWCCNLNRKPPHQEAKPPPQPCLAQQDCHHPSLAGQPSNSLHQCRRPAAETTVGCGALLPFLRRRRPSFFHQHHPAAACNSFLRFILSSNTEYKYFVCYSFHFLS